MNPPAFERPAFDEAVETWKKILGERNFSTEMLWIFQENLCIERSRAEQGGFLFGFQTKFTPPDEDAAEIAFDHFTETGARIVFYRLGDFMGKSVCILLCDPWFDAKGESEGYLRRDGWNISFHNGLDDKIEEVTDLTRWLRRVKRDRAFHDLDFCMALETIDEIKMHGRPLHPYERLSQRMINRMRTILGPS